MAKLDMAKIGVPVECMQPAFTLYGLKIRTTNFAEADTGTAQIGQLWQRFGQQVAPKMGVESAVYGIYTGYESDMNGEYDLWAGITEITQHSPELEKIEISAGRYLKFSHEGEMPTVVIELWQYVWAYFTAQGCPHERAYTADYELYRSATLVELFIAIK